MTVGSVGHDEAPLDIDSYREELRRWLAPEGAGADVLVGFRDALIHSHEDYVRLGQRMSQVLWEHGYKKYGWPRSVGGVGGGPRYRAVYYDELCAAGLFVSESDLPVEVLAPAVLAYAPRLAAEVLPAMLSGEVLWGQGFSEPEAGSDLASLRTRAVRSGDGYLVNGQKIWTSNGHLADQLFTLVRTGEPDSRHRGISVLLVDADSPGVTRRPIEFASGVAETCEVFFDDVRVGPDRLIGEENQGWEIAMFLLQYERSMYSAQRQAWLHQRLRRLAAQVSNGSARIDDSAPEALGRAWLAVQALRARAAETVARLDSGERVGPEASADKVLLATAEQAVFDAARRLLVPAFVAEASAQDWREQWWYSRGATIYGGSAEIQRTILADRVLGLPPEQARAARGR
jgi:alkylation response protein AidB-like acyl-CoA dehydrogenase